MENKVILLSICIPTYNRAKKLHKCLSCVTKAVSDREDVEIIVSDNCSTDDTSDVIKEFVSYKNVRTYRNDDNLGFNGNMTLLIDKYAKGKFCWIIGDDDLLDLDAIDLLCPILRKEEVPFLSIAHRCMTEEVYKKFEIPHNRKIDFSLKPYFECVDENSSGSNVLGTFMSTQIFKLDIIRKYDKSTFPINTWNDFKTVFPNSFMMTSSFHGCEKCGCVKTPLITALSYSKDWDDKLDKLMSTILPQYYIFCLDLCGGDSNKLKNNKRIIRSGVLSSEINRIKKSHNRIKHLLLLNPKYLLYYLNELGRALFFKIGVFR